MTRTSSMGLLGFIAFVLVVATAVDAQLSLTFYSAKCPNATQIVKSVVKTWIGRDRTLAPALLRLHFHDCFVRGCDASVLLDSPTGEKFAGGNRNSLRGFQVIDDVKAKLEAQCPGVVSCADILALAARDGLTAMTGRSHWQVPLGRRDGNVTSAAEANANLPPHTANYAQLLAIFAKQGLNEKDLVVLSGSHSIGLVHCSNLQKRLYSFNATFTTDPTFPASFAASLKTLCKSGDTTTLIKMDQSLPVDTWDGKYYDNVLNGRAMFLSDIALRTTASGLNLVNKERNATSDADFGTSMIKMGKNRVLTGTAGSIRQNCRVKK